MLVFVDTTYGPTFYIELNPNDKVIDIKIKIEKSQGIPVPMQALYYHGEPLLIDDLDLNTCNIVTKSRLLLVLLPYQEEDNNQVLLQQPTEQPLAPSTSVQDSLGQFQDWTATSRSNFRERLDQPEQSLARSAMASARHDKNQDSLQSEPSSSSNTFLEDLPSPTELFGNIGSHWPASTAEKSIDNSNVFSKEQSTIPSYTFGEILFGEDPPLPTEFFSNIGSIHTGQSTTPSNTFGDLLFAEDIFTSKEQVFQTEQPPVPSNSTEQRTDTQRKEVINVPPDSPVKPRRFRRPPPQRLRVMVLPHSPDNEPPVSKVPVSVMANENVEELRKKLEKLRERDELKLPEKGYFFIHKQNVLDDDKSFLWNGVAHGDTIEVFPGYVTKDDRTFG